MNGSIVGTSGVELFSNNIHLEPAKNKLRRKENDTQAVEFLSGKTVRDMSRLYCRFIAVGCVELGGYTVGTGSGS